MEKIKQEEFLRLVQYMRENYGINLEQKLTLVEGRLWNVIGQRGFASLGEYIEYVIGDKTGQEAKTLVTRLSTNYTYFMREDQHYKFMVNTILPELSKTLNPKDLRIWSAGCSSGEEPYTIAMVLDDFFGFSKSQWDCKVLATDISPQVLHQAVEAVYPADRLQNLPEAWKNKYFAKLPGDLYQVREELRGEVIFRSFNLMEKHLPFKKKFHIIFCRNVMIYFNKQTRDALVARYFDAIEPGGYLFIGMSETIGKGESAFEFISPAIYRKGR